MDPIVVPDYVEPMLAWRAWLPTATGILNSLTMPDVLAKDRRVHAAKCLSSHHRHSFNVELESIPVGTNLQDYPPDEPLRLRKVVEGVPAEGCTCGIYGVKELIEVPYIKNIRRIVVGRVKFWGKVIEGPRGYRAEFMEVVTLYCNDPLIPLVAQRYPLIPVKGYLELLTHHRLLTPLLRNITATLVYK